MAHFDVIRLAVTHGFDKILLENSAINVISHLSFDNILCLMFLLLTDTISVLTSRRTATTEILKGLDIKKLETA